MANVQKGKLRAKVQLVKDKYLRKNLGNYPRVKTQKYIKFKNVVVNVDCRSLLIMNAIF